MKLVPRSFALRAAMVPAAALLLALASAPPAHADQVVVAPPGAGVPGAITDLDSLFAEPLPQGTIVQFSPGEYVLTPRPYVEETCGNCEAESTQVTATVGLKVSGNGVWLIGPSDGEAIIRTNSGYGVLFEDCRTCTMEGLTITDGARDPDPQATDAAVVVKRSAVTIMNSIIRDNIGDSTLVVTNAVGIIGVAGREGAVLNLRNNRIIRNSWDGIALYRGAQGVIEGNVIDGVDLARGTQIGGGRGVGIGVTWNGFATIRGNLIRHYWKGLGVFVDAQVTAEENVIEHMATWGITLWDADRGRPSGIFRRNAILDTGACGASIVRTTDDPPRPGQFVQNVIARSGQDPRYDSGEPYCAQTALARHSVPEAFAISANLFFQNREPGGRLGVDDIKEDEMRPRLKPVIAALRTWDVLADSDFMKEFAPKVDAP